MADLNHLLKATSRSFYLTLRVLPSAVRPQIGLAERFEALKNLRERILGQRSTPLISKSPSNSPAGASSFRDFPRR
jgi:hypothetical protein